MVFEIDDIFTQTKAAEATRTVARETAEHCDSEFQANVIMAAGNQEYLDFTASQKDCHEIVFDISYAMQKQPEDPLGLLPDVRDFIEAFSQYCEMRLHCPVCVFIRPSTIERNKDNEIFVYMSTFIDCRRSVAKLLENLADVRSMQQRVLRKENTETWPSQSMPFHPQPRLSGHSMSIQNASLLNTDGTTSVTNGKTVYIDGTDRFIDHVYEMKYADDNYLREESLRTAEFNYVVTMLAEDLRSSGIFGTDIKPVERAVRQWMHKARLWKLEYRRHKHNADDEIPAF